VPLHKLRLYLRDLGQIAPGNRRDDRVSRDLQRPGDVHLTDDPTLAAVALDDAIA
jgi:hypothetical protein